MKMNKIFQMTSLLLAALMMGCGGGSGSSASGPSGWAIGNDPQGSAVILYTDNGGFVWSVQGDTSLWTGHGGNDISAVDASTAWAALNMSASDGGMILHTTDGGVTWKVQTLPQKVPDGVKGIKGVSRTEAWAVGLKGPVMHTMDGGQIWTVESTPGITFKQVNRIDVLGDDIWIADYGSGQDGMIHSSDHGLTWRREHLPGVDAGNGPMTASIVNAQVAWTTVNFQGDVFRTQDGGVTWNIDAPRISGANDIDDVCAIGKNEVWAVQNISGASAGYVMRIKIDGTDVIKSDWNFPNYVYEGVSAIDAKWAWVVGFKSIGAPAELPEGSILCTTDGQTWVSQALPVNNVGLWKISFAGTRR